MMQNIHKILIFGAGGFIGTHVSKKLTMLGKRPYKVFHHCDQPNTHSISADITNRKKIQQILQDINPDVVIHLAAAGVRNDYDHKRRNTSIFNTNFFGHYNILSSLDRTSCKLFINTGSCFEYGSKSSPCYESDTPQPLTIYGLSKYCATLVSHNYSFAHNTKLKIVTLRPFTVYGPGEYTSRLISSVYTNIVQHNPIHIPPNNVIRDFIYIDDVVDAYIQIIDKYSIVPSGIYNVSSGKGCSIQKIVRTIMTMLHSNDNTVNKTYASTDGTTIPYLVGNNSKIIHTIEGWKPNTRIAQGIAKTITWLSSTAASQ